MSGTASKMMLQDPSSCHVLKGAWGKTSSGAGKYFPNLHTGKRSFLQMVKSAAHIVLLLIFVVQTAHSAHKPDNMDGTDNIKQLQAEYAQMIFQRTFHTQYQPNAHAEDEDKLEQLQARIHELTALKGKDDVEVSEVECSDSTLTDPRNPKTGLEHFRPTNIAPLMTVFKATQASPMHTRRGIYSMHAKAKGKVQVMLKYKDGLYSAPARCPWRVQIGDDEIHGTIEVQFTKKLMRHHELPRNIHLEAMDIATSEVFDVQARASDSEETSDVNETYERIILTSSSTKYDYDIILTFDESELQKFDAGNPDYWGPDIQREEDRRRRLCKCEGKLE